MAIPLFVYLGAAGLGATYLLFRKKEAKAVPPASLPDFAAAMNARTEEIIAQNAALRAQGITPAGQGPRQVDASKLLVATNGVVFSVVSPPGFVGIDVSMGSQLGSGDIVTFDVTGGSLNSPVSSGNIVARVVGAMNPNTKSIPVITIDPRFPEKRIDIPLSAITDALAAGAIGTPSGNVVLGMS